ncbi:hypothetical protein PENTCL1PPCAC_24136, partial [Pristionchus entomophagus]
THLSQYILRNNCATNYFQSRGLSTLGHELIQNCKIDVLEIVVYSNLELQKMLQFIAHFPKTLYSFDFEYIPEIENLMSLPHIEHVRLLSQYFTFDSEFVVTLINVSRIIHAGYLVTINSDNMRKAMQLISSDSRKRNAQFYASGDAFAMYLRHHGIHASTKAGHLCGEFEVVSVDGSPDKSEYGMHLRYERCWLLICGHVWRQGDHVCSVAMANEKFSAAEVWEYVHFGWWS